MSARPAVSVVMPVRDPHPQHFPAAVESVLAQSLADFELLIVEDVGERSAADDLARLTDRRIRHLVNDGPGSMADARNRGLREARSEFVAMFDADDVCAPERLALQRARLDAESELAVVGSWLTILDEHGNKTGRRRYPTAHEDIVAALPIYNPLAHPSVMLRKCSVTASGGYRDRTCEDYDLWSRLARGGARFANLDDRLLGYRVHAGATKSRRLRESLRDTIRIKREHWLDQLGVRGRLRMLGERGLLLLPPSLVMVLFKRISLEAGVRA